MLPIGTARRCYLLGALSSRQIALNEFFLPVLGGSPWKLGIVGALPEAGWVPGGDDKGAVGGREAIGAAPVAQDNTVDGIG